ncbi:MAG: hypothetical protein AABZ39_11545 [Spirochaetota bacterium]
MRMFISLSGLLAAFIVSCGPNPAEYKSRAQPRIVEKADQYILEAPFNGKPKVCVGEGFGALFSAYFSMKGVPKGPGMPAPAARYEDFGELPIGKKQMEMYLDSVIWKGVVGISVPAAVTNVPQVKGATQPRLTTWKYGTVAEVVHFGPYEDEAPIIDNLKKFIASKGYRIAGLHEEEYIKGPGLPFVSPKDYITVIRYQVRKK